MRLIPAGAKYNSTILVDDQTNKILKIDCECPDFCFRRLKKIGECADIKVYATPCKHLQPAFDAVIKQGFTQKIPKEIVGPEKLPAKLRRELLEAAHYTCGCGSMERLQIHRKTRGNNGGKYVKENCVVLCHECHTIRHSGENK